MPNRPAEYLTGSWVLNLRPVLWRKMSMRNNLSAGRVQSVAVQDHRGKGKGDQCFHRYQFISGLKPFFTANDINDKTVSFKAEGAKQSNEEDAEKFLQSLYRCKLYSNRYPGKACKKITLRRLYHFHPSTGSQPKLGYCVSNTMLLAQKLYESGNITYMRTDSVNLSETAIDRYNRHRSTQLW